MINHDRSTENWKNNFGGFLVIETVKLKNF